MSQGELPTFPTVAIEDEIGNPWHKEEERRKRLSHGVDGAHMCIPLQCKICWMRNLEGRDQITEVDEVFQACIKRANLDSMVGKSVLTIANHVRETRTVIKNTVMINKTSTYYPRGPFPLGNPVGMGLAVGMELKSLMAKGRIRNHVQFSTLQRLWETHTKNWESSPLVGGGCIFCKRTWEDQTNLLPISIRVVL